MRKEQVAFLMSGLHSSPTEGGWEGAIKLPILVSKIAYITEQNSLFYLPIPINPDSTLIEVRG